MVPAVICQLYTEKLSRNIMYDINVIHQSKEHGKLVILVRCHICLASVSSCSGYLHYLVDLEEHQILSPTQFVGKKIRATSTGCDIYTMHI